MATSKNLGRNVPVGGRGVELKLPKAVQEIQSLVDSGHYQDALERCESRLKLFPACLATRLIKSACLISLDLIDDATDELSLLVFEYPHSEDVYRQLFRAVSLSGDAVDALGVARRWVEAVPESRDAHLALSRSSEACFYTDEALEALLKALKIEPSNAETWFMLGTFYLTNARAREAAAALQKGLELHPSYQCARIRLGRAFEELGLFEKAEQEFNTVLAQGFNPEAFQRLSALNKVSSNDWLFKAAEKLLVVLPENSQERSHLANGLALVYEREQRFEDAAAAFIISNRIRSRNLPFDREALELQLASIRECFSAEFCASFEGGANSKRPIFIVGMPQSGSTLVEQMLASHSKVHGGGELSYLQRLCFSQRPGEFFDEFQNLGPAQRTGLGGQYLALIKQLNSLTAFVCDKQLNNWQYVGFIKAILPNAKIINVACETNASNLAIFKRHFGNSAIYGYTPEELKWYRGQYDALMAHWDEVLPGAVYHLNCEDLVDDPLGVSQRLLSYLGLAFEEDVLAPFEMQEAPDGDPNHQAAKRFSKDARHLWRAYEDTSLASLFQKD
ncbi:tetratricopeptide repeat-containing sulfotransferase family protein [Pseudovibrio flavus]|uniref:tetratricopeptide repeat-containing sulfotransferase family protein n=1 Tax=Pseudovibrio flavus TaxID=2529854 RepID=UPI00352973C7